MAIQMRRGNAADYDESKIKSGEIAVATDSRQVFVGVGAGDAEELALKKDIPSGGGGTSDHSALTNRDAKDQHPVSAITGLQSFVDLTSVLRRTGDGTRFLADDGTYKIITGDGTVVTLDHPVISTGEPITDDTLLVINPDAQPDKIPEWYNGVDVSGDGVAFVSGSAAGDYYVNTNTFDVYYATAENTWKHIGSIKGNDGSSGIHVGTEAPTSTEKIWVDPDEGFSEEFLLTAEGVAAEVDNVPTHQALLFNSVAKSEISSGAITQVNFATAENSGSYVVAVPSSSDAYISVLKSGFYFIEGQVRYSHSSAPTAAFVRLLQNGGTIKHALGGIYGSNYTGYASAVIIAKCEAGDKLTLGYSCAGSGVTGSILAGASRSELHLRVTYLGGV